MTDALKVKLFVDEHIDEWHWDFNNEHITAFVSFSHLSELANFIGPVALSDTNIECFLKDGYIAIPDFDDILNHYELDEEDVDAMFPKDEHRY